MTTTLTVSTTAELNSAIAEADAASSGGFVIDLASNITQSASLDAINLNSAVTLTINGSAGTDYTLNGGGTYTGLDVVSAGGGTIIENLQLSDSVSTLAGGELAGSVTISSTATVDQTGQVTFGDATNGAATVDNYGTWDITGAWGITEGDPPSGSVFYNYGTMERDPNGVDGVSNIYVDVIDTGTLSVPDNNPNDIDTNLRFDGKNNSFSGTYVGAGMIDYGAGSIDALGTIYMNSAACSTDFGTVNQNGILYLSNNSTIRVQGTWNFTSDNGLVANNGVYQDDANFYEEGGTIEDTGTGTTVIGVPFQVYGGYGSIVVDNGTLEFNAPNETYFDGVPTSTFYNAISGAGIFSLGAGGNDAIDSGTSIATSGWTITDAGTEVTLNVSLSYSGTFTDQSAANLTLANGVTLTLANLNGSGGSITFDSDSELKFAGQSQSLFAATIDGFAAGDVIDLTSIANVGGSHADMNYSTNVLTITEGSNTYTLQFNPSQNFVGDYFHLTTDGTGTDITENTTPCYCLGTLIRTEGGEVPVEALTIGGKVITKSGKARSIKWIGRRSYDGRFVAGRKDVLPICIKTGALDDRVPQRDLWISPHHALYLDGALIEAKDLVNGVSIVQADQVENVEYFHIELETHDVIIAEGAPAESFIDDDSRGMFNNVREYRRLYGDAATGSAHFCAPRCDEGYQVEAVRNGLALRAGVRAEKGEPRLGRLRGFIDRVSADSVEGWAQNIEHPEAPVCLDIYAHGQLIGQTLANRYREDLAEAGLGSGRHAFVFTLPSGLIDGSDKVEVRRSLDDAALPGTRHSRAAA